MTKSKFFRLVAVVLAIALIVTLAVVFVPKLTHNCDRCDVFFVGTGYRANVFSDVLTAIGGKEDKILCEECAAKEHALEIAAGKTVDDFRIPLFDNSSY